MKKVSATEELKAARKAMADQQAMFQKDYNKILRRNVELVTQTTSQHNHSLTQKKLLEELDAIYKRTMALAEKLALEKDTLANANAKLVLMLDSLVSSHNKLAANQ